MSYNFKSSKFRIHKVATVNSLDVEETREKFKLNKGEFASLMNITAVSYSNCLRKGYFTAFRFYAAIDALENVVLKKALKDVELLHKIKTGLELTN